MDNNAMSNLIRGHVDTIILKALSEGDKYGYEICKEITENSGGQYELKQPTLYSCLKRLEKQGLIVSYWGTTATNGGRRHYYQLTETGRALFTKNQSQYIYTRTFLDNLISDKPYDASTPPPQEISLKLVPVGRKRAASDATTPEDAEEIRDGGTEETPSGEAVAKSARNGADRVEVDKDGANEVAATTAEAEPAPPPPSFVQYDLFDHLKVDVDKDIEEYETVNRMYEQTNVRGDFSEAAEKDDDADETLWQPTAYPAYRQGGDTPEGKAPETAKSYTDAILSESAIRAREILFSPTPVNVEPPQEEEPEDFAATSLADAETELEEEPEAAIADDVPEPTPPAPEDLDFPPQKEYKANLSRLLANAKTHTAPVETEVAEKPVKAQEPVPESPYEEPQTNILTVGDRVVVETAEDYSLLPHRQKGSADFSDLQARMQAEGFKIRTHSKAQEASPSGKIFSSLLMLHTLLLVAVIAAAELLVIYFAVNASLGIPSSVYITLGSVLGAMVLMALILYGVNPGKKSRDRFQFGVSMGLAAILTVLAFLASFAVALLAASQLSMTAKLFQNVLLPTVLALNMPIGVAIYAVLRKQKRYKA